MSGIRGVGRELPLSHADKSSVLKAPPARHASEEKRSFGDVLKNVSKQFEHAESVMNTGSVKSPVEMLAVQASMYHYTEMVTVAAKLVEGAASAVKTVLTKEG